MQDTIETAQRESMEVDVLIVGGGPAGLATACRLMQLSEANDHSLQVVILEKAAEIGGHTLSGAVIETRASVTHESPNKKFLQHSFPSLDFQPQ